VFIKIPTLGINIKVHRQMQNTLLNFDSPLELRYLLKITTIKLLKIKLKNTSFQNKLYPPIVFSKYLKTNTDGIKPIKRMY
jgi:hypothetical protein